MGFHATLIHHGISYWVHIILGTWKSTQTTAQETHALTNRCNGNLSYMFELLNFFRWLTFSIYLSTRMSSAFVPCFPWICLSFWCAFPWWEAGCLTAEDSAGHTANVHFLSHCQCFTWECDILWFWWYNFDSTPLRSIAMTKQALHTIHIE